MFCKAKHCYFHTGEEKGAECGMADYLDKFGRCRAYYRSCDPDEARQMRDQIRVHLQNADAVVEMLADYAVFRHASEQRSE